MQTISRDDLDRVTGGTTININLGDLLQQLMQAQGGQPAGPQDPSAQAAAAQAAPQQAPQQQGGGGGLNIGSLISMFSGLMGGGGQQGGGQGGQGGAPSMAGGAGMMG